MWSASVRTHEMQTTETWEGRWMFLTVVSTCVIIWPAASSHVKGNLTSIDNNKVLLMIVLLALRISISKLMHYTITPHLEPLPKLYFLGKIYIVFRRILFYRQGFNQEEQHKILTCKEQSLWTSWIDPQEGFVKIKSIKVPKGNRIQVKKKKIEWTHELALIVIPIAFIGSEY